MVECYTFPGQLPLAGDGDGAALYPKQAQEALFVGGRREEQEQVTGG